MDNADLQRLPVRDLATDGCLIAVWTTNRQRTREYVTQELFPRWNVTFITCWYWLKVSLCRWLWLPLFTSGIGNGVGLGSLVQYPHWAWFTFENETISVTLFCLSAQLQMSIKVVGRYLQWTSVLSMIVGARTGRYNCTLS